MKKLFKEYGWLIGFVALVLSAVVYITQADKQQRIEDQQEMLNCTFGGPDRLLAKQHVEKRQLIQETFKACLETNRQRDVGKNDLEDFVKVCTSASYTTNGLVPVGTDTYDTYFQKVIANVEQCGGK